MFHNLDGLKSNLPLFAVGGGVAIVGAFWGQIKEFFTFIYGLFIVEIDLDYTTHIIVFDYLHKAGKLNSIFKKRKIEAKWIFYKPAHRNVELPTEKGGKLILFFENYLPIFITVNKSKEDGISYRLSHIRFAFNFDNFLKQAYDKNISLYTTESNRVFIQRFVGKATKMSKDDEDDMLAPSTSDSFVDFGFHIVGYNEKDTKSDMNEYSLSNYCFSDKCLEAIEFLKKWKESRDWYNSKAIPWSSGLALVGLPGCGKSSFCKVLSSTLNIPILIFDAATMSNEEFLQYWKRAQMNAPCITLIEDIDRIFDRDKNLTTGEMIKQHLTFDCLLNCISGVESNQGIITIITANNADRIDKALGQINEDGTNSRPGRMDFILHFDVLNETARIKIANKMFGDFNDINLIQQTVKESEGMTGAQFINKCSVLALNRYWKEKND